MMSLQNRLKRIRSNFTHDGGDTLIELNLFLEWVVSLKPVMLQLSDSELWEYWCQFAHRGEV